MWRQWPRPDPSWPLATEQFSRFFLGKGTVIAGGSARDSRTPIVEDAVAPCAVDRDLYESACATARAEALASHGRGQTGKTVGDAIARFAEGVSVPQRQRPLVLHIITRVIVGGAQLTVLETCAGLKDTYDFHVICGPQEGVEGTIRPRLENVASVTVLSELRREITHLRTFGRWAGCDANCVAAKAAVVHTHSSKAGILGRQAPRARASQSSAHSRMGPSPNDLRFKLLPLCG